MIDPETLANDYRTIFNSPAGKRIIEDLKDRSMFDAATFFPGAEPWQPPYRDGARSVIRYIVEKSMAATDKPVTTNKPDLK